MKNFYAENIDAYKMVLISNYTEEDVINFLNNNIGLKMGDLICKKRSNKIKSVSKRIQRKQKDVLNDQKEQITENGSSLKLKNKKVRKAKKRKASKITNGNAKKRKMNMAQPPKAVRTDILSYFDDAEVNDNVFSSEKFDDVKDKMEFFETGGFLGEEKTRKRSAWRGLAKEKIFRVEINGETKLYCPHLFVLNRPGFELAFSVENWPCNNEEEFKEGYKAYHCWKSRIGYIQLFMERKTTTGKGPVKDKSEASRIRNDAALKERGYNIGKFNWDFMKEKETTIKYGDKYECVVINKKWIEFDDEL